MKPGVALASCASSPGRPKTTARFHRTRSCLCTRDPIPKVCPCKSAHLPVIGLSADQKFPCSDGLLLGVSFWRRIFQRSGRMLSQLPVRMERRPQQHSHSLPVPLSLSLPRRSRGSRCIADGCLGTSLRVCCGISPIVKALVTTALSSRKTTFGCSKGPRFSLIAESRRPYHLLHGRAHQRRDHRGLRVANLARHLLALQELRKDP